MVSRRSHPVRIRADAMVVCPCTMGTLAAIAAGMADNLIERAADVALKEARKLVLVPREAPLSAIHLEKYAQAVACRRDHSAGQSGFYHHPQTAQDPRRLRGRAHS
jgi:4-hydroxy-3-polyprenylbenzoate decarboxylase